VIPTRRPVLHTSRRTVLELAALFSLDSAGSGFVVTSLLVLWLHLRFDLTAGATGAVFFAAGLLGACSQALAPRLARRLGLIRTMARDKVIVLSTHILEEVQAVCTRAIIIAAGRVLLDGTPSELEARSPLHNAVAVELAAGSAPRAREELAALSGVLRVDVLEGQDGLLRLRVVPARGTNLTVEIARLAQGKGWQVQGLALERGRLEEVFRQVTTTVAVGEGAR